MKVAVQVKPNARTDSVEVVDDIYVVRTKAQAVDGKANEAVVTLIAGHMGVPKTRVRIVRGATSKHKVIDVTD